MKIMGRVASSGAIVTIYEGSEEVVILPFGALKYERVWVEPPEANGCFGSDGKNVSFSTYPKPNTVRMWRSRWEDVGNRFKATLLSLLQSRASQLQAQEQAVAQWQGESEEEVF